MWHAWADIYSPLYVVAILALLLLLASIFSHTLPFFERELKIENQTRLTPLDGLRGILCFAVMCHHGVITFSYLDSQRWELPRSNLYCLLGQSSVAFFFCITAFLFCTRAIMQNGLIETKPFLRGRFFRIAPLYLFSGVLAIAVLSRQIHWGSLPVYRDIVRIFALGFQPWGKIGTIDAGKVDADVTWTLRFEWAFYLVLPSVALILRGDVARRLWLLFAGTFLMFGMGPALFFFPGCLAAHVVQRAEFVQWLRRKFVSVGLVCLIVVTPMITGNGFSIKALVATTLIFVPIACGNDLFGLLTLRGLRLMGVVSYSVYLLHGIALYVARPMLTSAQYDPSNAWHYWAKVAGLACLTLIVCMGTYRWVEWPFIQYEKRSRRRAFTSQQVRQSATPASTSPAA